MENKVDTYFSLDSATNSHLNWNDNKICNNDSVAYAFYWCFKSRANEFCCLRTPFFLPTIRNTSSSAYDFRGHTKNSLRNGKTVCHFVMDYLNKSRKFLAFLLSLQYAWMCVVLQSPFILMCAAAALTFNASYNKLAEFIIAIRSIDAVHYQQFSESWQLRPKNRNIKSDHFKQCAKRRAWFWSRFFFNFCLSA